MHDNVDDFSIVATREMGRKEPTIGKNDVKILYRPAWFRRSEGEKEKSI